VSHDEETSRSESLHLFRMMPIPYIFCAGASSKWSGIGAKCWQNDGGRMMRIESELILPASFEPCSNLSQTQPNSRTRHTLGDQHENRGFLATEALLEKSRRLWATPFATTYATVLLRAMICKASPRE